MNNNAYIPISDLQLVLSVILVLMTGAISAFLKLGLFKSLIWATLRAFIQLMLIGYVLTYVFQLNNLPVILSILLIMCLIASREAVQRLKKTPFQARLETFLSLTASSFIVGMIVVVLLISPRPWYSAQVMIPIFGMIIGNSMNAIALSLERMYSEMHTHIAQVEQLLAFGATPWEAARDSVRKSLTAGMMPTINSLTVVGLVSLPGMMTGQILAGMDPSSAVRYQFVVMIMIASAVAIGCLLIIGLSYKKMFNKDQALIDSMHQ